MLLYEIKLKLTPNCSVMGVVLLPVTLVTKILKYNNKHTNNSLYQH